MHWCTAKGRIMHLFFVLSLCLYSVHLFLFYLSLALIVSDLAAPKYPSGPQRIEYFVKFQMQIWSKFSCTFGGKIQMFLLNTDATVGVPSERDSRRQCGSRPARSCSQVARRPAITLALPAKMKGSLVFILGWDLHMIWCANLPSILAGKANGSIMPYALGMHRTHTRFKD